MPAFLSQSLKNEFDAENQRSSVKKLADEVKALRREQQQPAMPAPEPEQPVETPPFDLQSHIQQLTSTWRDDTQPAVSAAPKASVYPSALTAPYRDDRKQPQAMPAGAAAAGQTGAPPQMAAGTGVAPDRAGDYRAYARQVAAQYGVDPDIFERQINQESGFNPSARSPVGAAGIAQFMPGTAAGYGVDVNDPYSSLDGAARHMRDLLKANGGNYRMALAAYNAGQGNVDKWGEGVFDDDFAQGQTRDYVNIILGPGSARPAPRQSLNAGSATSPAQPASPSGAAGVPPASSAALPPTLAQAFRSANGREPTPAEAAELSQAFGLGAMA